MSDRLTIISRSGRVFEMVNYWQVLLAHGPYKNPGRSTGHDISRGLISVFWLVSRFEIWDLRFEIYSTDESGRLNFSLKSQIFGFPRIKSGAYLRFLTGQSIWDLRFEIYSTDKSGRLSFSLKSQIWVLHDSGRGIISVFWRVKKISCWIPALRFEPWDFWVSRGPTTSRAVEINR